MNAMDITVLVVSILVGVLGLAFYFWAKKQHH